MIAPARGASLGSIRELTACQVAGWLPWLDAVSGCGAAQASSEQPRADSPPRVELEIGFGKGRYLLGRAAAEPHNRFLGIEIVSQYFRLVARRAARRRLDNLSLLHAEALYALATLLPRGFADAVHVYHPDPWPKARHHKRRLFDVESIDLLLAALKPTGELLFASDHVAYSDVVEHLLRSHSALSVESVDAWPEGPRTHYEAKFVALGQPVRRLVARFAEPERREVIHPDGLVQLASAWTEPVDLSEKLEGAAHH